MTVKIFFLVLILIACLAQEYNAKEINTERQLPSTGIQIVNHIDKFDDFTNTLKNYFESLGSHSLNCYLQHEEYLKRTTKFFAEAIKKLEADYEEVFTDQFKNIGKELEKRLDTIANLTATYPNIMYELIREDQYQNAIMYLDEIWEQFKLAERQFLEQLKEFKNKNPDFIINTKESYEEIRNDAKSKGIHNYSEFQMCLKSKPSV